MAAGLVAYGLWRKLTPAQRRLLLEAARTHGPKVAAAARTHGPKLRQRRGRGRRSTQALIRPRGDAERGPDDAVLLDLVRGRIALARRGAPGAADVGDAGDRRAGAGGVVEPMADRAPGAHVLRLLLRPDDLLEAAAAPRCSSASGLDRERVELLEPRDRDVGRARPRARGRRCRSRPCRCRARAGARPGPRSGRG